MLNFLSFFAYVSNLLLLTNIFAKISKSSKIWKFPKTVNTWLKTKFIKLILWVHVSTLPRWWCLLRLIILRENWSTGCSSTTKCCFSCFSFSAVRMKFEAKPSLRRSPYPCLNVLDVQSSLRIINLIVPWIHD